MFSHPVSLVGYLTIVVGGFLTFQPVISLYGDVSPLALFGPQIIGFGCFAVLVGIIAQGFLMLADRFGRIEHFLEGDPAMKASFDANMHRKNFPFAKPAAQTGTETAQG